MSIFDQNPLGGLSGLGRKPAGSGGFGSAAYPHVTGCPNSSDDDNGGPLAAGRSQSQPGHG